MRKIIIGWLLLATSVGFAQEQPAGKKGQPAGVLGQQPADLHLALIQFPTYDGHLGEGTGTRRSFDYRMALLDGLNPMAGRRVRVLPVRVTLKDGTVLTADPTRIKDSLAKLKPLFPVGFEKAFEESVTDETGLHKGTFLVDNTKVEGVALAVLDLHDGRVYAPSWGRRGFLSRAKAPASFEQGVLADVLTLTPWPIGSWAYTSRYMPEYKTLTRKREVRLENGSVETIVEGERVLVREGEIYVPLKIQRAYEKDPERTIRALAHLVETGAVPTAKIALHYFIGLRPEKDANLPFKAEMQNFDQVDPARKLTPRQQCLAEMEHHLEMIKTGLAEKQQGPTKTSGSSILRPKR